MNYNNEKRIVINDPKVKRMLNANLAKDTDPFGSYTGKPVNEYEVPVQDQDDL